MNKPFSDRSLGLLLQIHPDLKRLFIEVNDNHQQCTIFSGSRSIDEERKFVAEGLSHTMHSKHLLQSDGFSHAVDAGPDPVNWESSDYSKRLLDFSDIVKDVAKSMGIKIIYGGDWHSFSDLDHFEIA